MGGGGQSFGDMSLKKFFVIDALSKSFIFSRLIDDDNKFELSLDTHQFLPEEIRIVLQQGKLYISGPASTASFI